MTWLVALACALAPCLILPRLITMDLIRARDLWLRGSLVVATGCLIVAEPIFAPIGAWFCWRWRGVPREEPTTPYRGALISWVAIGGAWFAVRAVPRETMDCVPLAWLAWTLVQVAWMLVQRRDPTREDGRSPAGSFGQRTMAAAFLALVLPFAPWPLWPAIGLGLWLTGPSWGAGLAILAGWPLAGSSGWLPSASWAALAASGGALWLGIRSGGRPVPAGPLWRLFDRTPRGPSFGTLLERGQALRLIWRHRGEALPWGQGPYSMWVALSRLNHAYKVKLPWGDLHMDPGQFVWEYGLAGLAAILLLVYRVGTGLRWADPWSASAVIALVLCATSWPARVPPVGLTMLIVWARVAP